MRATLAVLWALLAGFAVLAVVQGDFWSAADAYREMAYGGLGDFPRWWAQGDFGVVARPWGESALKASLLIFSGLSVAVGLTGGVFNIGVQGQTVIGALIAAALGAHLALPAPLHLAACLIGAAIGGGLWGLLCGGLKVWRGVHEVISGIMLNWTAVICVEQWLLLGPLRASSVDGLARAGSSEVLPSAHLPRLLGDSSRIHFGFPLALGAVLAVWLWQRRSVHGFQIRALGLSSEVSRTQGIPVGRRTLQGFFGAGALAALGGAVWVLGSEFQYPATWGGGYGFDGIATALVGGGHPVGVALASILFGAMRAGGTRMQLLGVHQSFPELLQALTLLGIAVGARASFKVRRKAAGNEISS